ncbi:MAG: 50S ribosomal protein L3 [Rickettsiales bacterium]|nr:50S ribosomal protein L3 [Rickettsiales bacterium]
MVGKKLGMSRIYLDNGVVVPVTLIKVYDGLISDFKTYDDKDFNHVVLSYGKDKKTEKRINKSVLGFYKKKNLEAYDHMKTFKVSKDENFNVGDVLDFNQFKLGDNLNITGISKGKGYAGVMKRHHYSGLEAAHGVSVSHRSIGSTGNRRREGKVMKGKAMAGHMGSEQVTVKNLQVVGIENNDGVICVKGAVPGSKGSDLIIKIANK